MRLTFLGTGTSTGVPVIGCRCAVCRSDDARDRRLRTSALVETEPNGEGGLRFVIDTGPDFRAQALRAHLTRLDAVLYTHSHFDHVAGLDDLRPFLFENRTPLPCYAAPETAAVLRRTYPYAWGESDYPGVPVLRLEEIGGPPGAPAPFRVGSRYGSGASVDVVPIPAWHGTFPVLGFRVGALAYLTDVSAVPDASLALLGGLDVLVLDALRHEPHPTHFSIGEAVAMAARIGARRTFFVHMTHTVAHAAESARLPEGVFFAHDGLVVEVREERSKVREEIPAPDA